MYYNAGADRWKTCDCVLISGSKESKSMQHHWAHVVFNKNKQLKIDDKLDYSP